MNNNKVIHVCVVSDQLLGNLIPALQLRPREVVALVTPTMRQRDVAARFKFLLGKNGIACLIEDFPESGFSDALAAARALAAKLSQQFPDTPVGVNLTGGTKPMAFALVMGLRAHQRAADFYCDTQNNVIETFEFEATPRRVALQDVVDVELAVNAQGYAVVGEPSRTPQNSELLELASELVDVAVRAPANMTALQAWLNQPGMGAGKTGQRPWRKSLGKRVCDLLDRACELDLLTRRPDGALCHAPAAQGFLHMSGWFEAWCAAQLHNAGAPQPLLDLKVKAMPGDQLGRLPSKEEHDQQFDVAVAWKNRLILVECKATWPTVGHGRHIVSGAHRAGGLFGLKLLVATGAAQPAVAERTAALGWKLVSGEEVLTLQERVADWMQKASRA